MPTAKRNSYRVARLMRAATQGSVLRPQPWAGKTQLLQSCQGCVPSTTSPPNLHPKGKEKSQNKGPTPAFPKGKENLQNALNTASTSSRHLGRVGEGLPLFGLHLKKAQTFPIPFGEAGEVWATDKSQADYSAIVIHHLLHTSRCAGRGWVWCYRLYRCQTVTCLHRYLRAGCAWLPHVCALTGVLHNYVSLSYSLFTYLSITLTASVVSIFPSPLTSAVALLSLSVMPLI